ncbi:MAG: NADP-dependent isocitrate dehydrogenase [Pseudobdellovibrionaceae bacterium]
MSTSRRITVAYGDGIGPEVMKSTLEIMRSAGARLEYDVIEIGEKVYQSGQSSGIAPESWDILRRNKIFLKAPITTPQGGGFKSLNVTIRKGLGLYANVRPNLSYAPIVKSLHPKMDLVIVRENEEDLYAGIEHRQSEDVYQCLKVLSRPGTEKIIRYAFEYAKRNGRKKVTCLSKDNIMKLTDGMFHKVFDEVSKEYPGIETDHKIIDIGAAFVAERPQIFDVIVTLNLYGDIISDIAAQVSGSVGLASSANIGDHGAMFEAIHGSAPDIAGKDLANPSGLLLSAVDMLVHLGQGDVATKIHNAWLKTMEDGVHTGDLFDPQISKQKVGTSDFTQAVIERLGEKPQKMKPVSYQAGAGPLVIELKSQFKESKKVFKGIDIFVADKRRDAEKLAQGLSQLQHENLKLKMITNRGVKVWPEGLPETFCTDHFRTRWMWVGREPNTQSLSQVYDFISKVTEQGFDVIKTENLYSFDGLDQFSLGQGE